MYASIIARLRHYSYDNAFLTFRLRLHFSKSCCWRMHEVYEDFQLLFAVQFLFLFPITRTITSNSTSELSHRRNETGKRSPYIVRHEHRSTSVRERYHWRKRRLIVQSRSKARIREFSGAETWQIMQPHVRTCNEMKARLTYVWNIGWRSRVQPHLSPLSLSSLENKIYGT